MGLSNKKLNSINPPLFIHGTGHSASATKCAPSCTASVLKRSIANIGRLSKEPKMGHPVCKLKPLKTIKVGRINLFQQETDRVLVQNHRRYFATFNWKSMPKYFSQKTIELAENRQSHVVFVLKSTLSVDRR